MRVVWCSKSLFFFMQKVDNGLQWFIMFNHGWHLLDSDGGFGEWCNMIISLGKHAIDIINITKRTLGVGTCQLLQSRRRNSKSFWHELLELDRWHHGAHSLDAGDAGDDRGFRGVQWHEGRAEVGEVGEEQLQHGDFQRHQEYGQAVVARPQRQPRGLGQQLNQIRSSGRRLCQCLHG